jgi:hypothetical protein
MEYYLMQLSESRPDPTKEVTFHNRLLA